MFGGWLRSAAFVAALAGVVLGAAVTGERQARADDGDETVPAPPAPPSAPPPDDQTPDPPDAPPEPSSPGGPPPAQAPAPVPLRAR